MYRNNEGYPDPTAAAAIRKADKTPELVEWYIKMIKDLARIFDFELIGKVQIRDKKTNRIYR